MSRFAVFTLAALVAFLLICPSVQASIVTGDPLGDDTYEWKWSVGSGPEPKSTNALNYDQQTPGHVGKVTPYVLFDSATENSVTLFFSAISWGAFFEYRVDGVSPVSPAHAVVLGDTQHSGFWFPAGSSGLRTIPATSTVDVRLALGPERDSDFNWVQFDVAQAAVPEPATIAVWSLLALAGGGVAWRQKSRQS